MQTTGDLADRSGSAVSDFLNWPETIFGWIIIVSVPVSVMIALTYLALDVCSSAQPPLPPPCDVVPGPSALHVPRRAVINVTTREYCSTVSKDLYLLEQLGYVDADRHVSRLLALQDVGVGDVHYVLANDTHVPVLFACSLESVLRAMDNRSRVNVFVVFGIEFERPVLDEQRPVSLIFLVPFSIPIRHC